MNIEQRAERLIALKKQMDEIEENYKIESKAMMALMKEQGKTQFIHNAYQIDIQSRTTNKVDVEKFKALVTPEQFEDSIEVKIGKVKEYVPTRLQESCIIPQSSTEFIKVIPTKAARKETAEKVVREVKTAKAESKKVKGRRVDISVDIHAEELSV